MVTTTNPVVPTAVVTDTDPSHYHVPTVEIGNQVWIESDHDGLSATNLITPVVGTVVTAVAPDGTVYTGTTDATGHYTPIWIAGVVLGIVAFVVHLPITDKPIVVEKAASAVP